MRSIRLKLTISIFLASLSGMFFTVLVISDRIVGVLATEELISRAVLREDLGDAVQLAVVGSVLVSLGVGTLLGRSLSRPIQQLTETSQRLAEGRLGEQVPITTQDEVGQLARAFNQMSTDLAEARQQQEQMTADIAHDLRTPLSVIAGYAEALDEGKLASSPVIFRTIRQQVDHLQHLIEDLRTLSLADAGELALHLRPIEPVALLERTALAFMPTAADKQISLRIDAADTLPDIRVDIERMTQVLNNLIGNALRYTLSEGEVVLSARVCDGRVQLCVADTGGGIPVADLPHIFDRFYRADKSRTRHLGGSGLGLAIANAIVVAHQGTLQVASSTKGTTFTISF